MGTPPSHPQTVLAVGGSSCIVHDEDGNSRSLLNFLFQRKTFEELKVGRICNDALFNVYKAGNGNARSTGFSRITVSEMRLRSSSVLSGVLSFQFLLPSVNFTKVPPTSMPKPKLHPLQQHLNWETHIIFQTINCSYCSKFL